MPATQIGRALQELGIVWIPAHSPQCERPKWRGISGRHRIDWCKGMRVAGVTSIEQANQYLEESYLVWWESGNDCGEPAHSDDAHQGLDKSHKLEASPESCGNTASRGTITRFRLDAELYRIERHAVVSGLRKADVRVEKRLDGSVAVRFGERYLPVKRCDATEKTRAPSAKPTLSRRPPASQRGREWGKNLRFKERAENLAGVSGLGQHRKAG